MVSQADYFPQYRNVRVAVLGATGFIGAWVARALTRAGADLHLLVRDTSKTRLLSNQSGIRGQLIEIDLIELHRLQEVVDSLSPTITFNLAGYGIDRAETDEELSKLINTEVPIRLVHELENGSDWTGQTLVHVGSALEYGTTGGNLAEEGPATPTTLYGQSKLAGTLGVQSFAQSRGLRAVTARLFTAYGPGEHKGRLVPTLLEAAVTRRPLPLTAGTQLRDFTYVEDVAEGLLRLGISRALPGQVVNLATGRLTSVRQFVETAAEVLGIPRSNLRFGEIPTRPEEMIHDPISLNRLNELTRWTPGIDIAEGMRRTRQSVEAVPIIDRLVKA